MTSHNSTLRYWLDVEALTYPEIPKPGKRRHYTLDHGSPLPWQQSSVPVIEDHKYFVYFGLVQKRVLERELFELFRATPESNPGGTHERKQTGKTFLCAMEVSADGQPAVATLQLAAFAAAFASKKLGRVVRSPDILEALKQQIANIRSDSPSGVADAEWFKQVIDFLVARLEWQPKELMAGELLCIHRVPLLNSEGKPLRPPPEMDPINSFYVDDLQRIGDSLQAGAAAPQVKAYLDGGSRHGGQIDVTQLKVIDAQLQAARFPQGRWPSKFPLFLMQQVAVNTALEALADHGIFSVNGPPGTGKTTLLMDVIAARLVQRATILAGFEEPLKAFGRSPAVVTYPPNKMGEVRNGSCYFVDERLLDGGIVVASANNKAVENITRDLPNLDKVWPQPLMLDDVPFDYFAASAQAVLKASVGKSGKRAAGDDGQMEDDDSQLAADFRCWGMVSAALGKKKNRGLIVSQLNAFAEYGISKMLERLPASRKDWAAARRRFTVAVSRVSEIQSQIAAFDRSLPAWRDASDRLVLADVALVEASNLRQRCLEQLDALAQQLHVAEVQLTGNLQERQQYALDWPWWRLLWTRCVNRTRYAAVGKRRQELEQEYSELRARRADVKRGHAEKQTELAKRQAVEHEAQALRARLEHEVAHLAAELARLRGLLGEAAFDPVVFAALPVHVQQKALPRSNAALHAARAEVFVAAMALHQAFIAAAGKGFETNFRLALSMLAGEAHIQPHLKLMARHLWATFFLAVPVVSSTFASVARCFCDLGEGEIGLLLIDEAGQAVPSHALGAIWRSRRALIVGDPLQVEPVISMDKKLDLEILKFHQAPEAHMLTRYSAQHLADRANRFGSNLRQYDGADLWVGSPLRVHRRCVDPMFSISNAIAYNDKMVFGPDPQEEEAATVSRPLLGPSRWIDVTGGDFEEHFNPAEGRIAFDMIRAYHQRGLCGQRDGLPELYLITPFKSVATEMTALLRAHVHAWAAGVEEEMVAAWLQSHVGTVHTFQGKENESVIFVLGGRSAGARSWAASSPNIINVAITRAKRRLYVIGNKKAWAETSFGRALAQAMP